MEKLAAFFCRIKPVKIERTREIDSPVYKMDIVSRFFPKEILCATHLEMAVSIPAEVKEKQSA